MRQQTTEVEAGSIVRTAKCFTCPPSRPQAPTTKSAFSLGLLELCDGTLFPPRSACLEHAFSLIIQSKAAVREGEMARPWSVALAVSVAVLLPAGTGADLSHASAFVAPAVARLSSLGSPLSQNKLALPHPTRGRRDPLALRCMAQPGTETKPVDPAWVSGTKTLKATEYYKPLVAGDILESTDQQRGIVVGSYVALAALFVKGCLLLPPMSAAVASPPPALSPPSAAAAAAARVRTGVRQSAPKRQKRARVKSASCSSTKRSCTPAGTSDAVTCCAP